MKKLLLTALLLLPLPAVADHLDVLEIKLIDGCTFPQFMEIVADFNKWGETVGYNAEIAFPLQSNNLTSLYWLGRSDNAAAYGNAWDTWRDALADPSSDPSELWARFQTCSENISRRGYDLY
ncbi:MAG TPA: hypothetical protein VKN35_13345 [Xanthomonadales bacterium]|nr:hypothetical protein [Xanthomonadales bacterium]